MPHQEKENEDVINDIANTEPIAGSIKHHIIMSGIEWTECSDTTCEECSACFYNNKGEQ